MMVEAKSFPKTFAKSIVEQHSNGTGYWQISQLMMYQAEESVAVHQDDEGQLIPEEEHKGVGLAQSVTKT